MGLHVLVCSWYQLCIVLNEYDTEIKTQAIKRSGFACAHMYLYFVGNARILYSTEARQTRHEGI